MKYVCAFYPKASPHIPRHLTRFFSFQTGSFWTISQDMSCWKKHVWKHPRISLPSAQGVAETASWVDGLGLSLRSRARAALIILRLTPVFASPHHVPVSGVSSLGYLIPVEPL